MSWFWEGLQMLRYGVIYADPPWSFKTYSEKGNGRGCAYNTMSLEAISALRVADLAASVWLVGMHGAMKPARSGCWVMAEYLSLRSLCDICGEGPALRLVSAKGGCRTYIPGKLPDDHELIGIVGQQAAESRAARLCV